MSFLINRKAPSRIECLHSLLKFLYEKFGRNIFDLKGCLFSQKEKNIHKFCSLIEKTEFGLCCPFKDSPLSLAGCYITNGILDDSTKLKEVGNTINAIHGMGFVDRNKHSIKITDLGVVFCTNDLFSQENREIVKNAVLSYGPIIGILDEIFNKQINGKFSIRDISVGYPSSEEKVLKNGVWIPISAGSTQDANTRSRSCYVSWLVAAGVIEPENIVPDCESDIPYLKYRSFINAVNIKASKYRITCDINSLFSSISITKRPLDYNNLTKLTRALRENNQSVIRKTTMNYESIIKNRRFAIVYLLNKCYENKTSLSFKALYEFMIAHSSLFVIPNNDFCDTLRNELHIANVVGIPFSVTDDGNDFLLTPKIGVDVSELSIGAPNQLVQILCHF